MLMCHESRHDKINNMVKWCKTYFIKDSKWGHLCWRIPFKEGTPSGVLLLTAILAQFSGNIIQYPHVFKLYIFLEIKIVFPRFDYALYWMLHLFICWRMQRHNFDNINWLWWIRTPTRCWLFKLTSYLKS